MIKMEFAKFIFKYSNDMLPKSFDNYFTEIENVAYIITIHDKNIEMSIFNLLLRPKQGKKNLQYIGINIWKTIPENFRHCSFTKFKKYCKNYFLDKYSWTCFRYKKYCCFEQ